MPPIDPAKRKISQRRYEEKRRRVRLKRMADDPDKHLEQVSRMFPKVHPWRREYSDNPPENMENER